MASPLLKPSIADWCADTFVGMEWCVAGGAVRDALLNQKPKDFDVFVMDRTELVTERMERQEKDRSKVPPSAPYQIGATRVDGETVQVMAMPHCTDIAAVLDSFDWNCCRFAVNRLGVLFSPGVLPRAGEDLSLHRLTFAQSTLLRGIRFAARFGASINSETARYIVATAVEQLRAKSKQAVAS